MVPFSLFDVDQICEETTEKFKNEDPLVYSWDAPDFLNDSLFADFLMYLHKAFKKNLKRLKECIHEPEQPEKVILALNELRTENYEEQDIGVYEQITNATKENYEVSVEPKDDKINCLYLLITDKIDPDNTIREEMIRKSKLKEQLQSQSDEEEEEYSREKDSLQEGCKNTTGVDNYPPDEDKLEDCLPTRPGKPCYYSSQMEMGSIL